MMLPVRCPLFRVKLNQSLMVRVVFRPSDISVDCLANLCSHVTPVYPFESVPGTNDRFDWIFSEEAYKKWADSSGPSILHVHGTDGSSYASEYIFRSLDVYQLPIKDNKINLYFSFSRHDDRANSVTAMLNTLLAQCINHNQDFYGGTGSLCQLMTFYRSWTQIELWLLFQHILWNWEHGYILCVINGLDECDDSRMIFLKELCAFAERVESRFKIIFTSTDDSDILAVLAQWPTINMNDQPLDTKLASANIATGTDLEAYILGQQLEELGQPEMSITNNLSEYGQNQYARLLLESQVKREELDLLPRATVNGLFARILGRVPLEKRAWARRALSWILYSFHPLTIWQLSIALNPDFNDHFDGRLTFDEPVSQNALNNLEVFGGMFILRHNEVHFAHPDARKFLMDADSKRDYAWYDVKQTAHQEIVNACHSYLSLQRIQQSIAMDNGPILPRSPVSPTPIPRHSFAFYAISYWPRHYNLIPELERDLEFVQDTSAMRCWAGAYWWLLNLTKRSDRSFLSLLPTYAGLGFGGLVEKWLVTNTERTTNCQDYASALELSAYNSHVKIVRSLLMRGGYSQSNLQDSLVAAVSSCNETILDHLITYVVDNFKNFEWPSAVLCRATQFGLDKIVRKLLKLGASPNTDNNFYGMTPLHFASRFGHVEVVKLLLEHKGSLTAKAGLAASSLRNYVPLLMAADSGHPLTVTLLLAAGADINAVDEMGRSAVFLACLRGNYKAVKILAEAGCNLRQNTHFAMSPLEVAVSSGFLKSAQALLETCRIDFGAKGGGNGISLRYATVRGDVELCRLLLDHGADPNPGARSLAILGEAARQGNLELVRLLCQEGAEVDYVDDEGWTALQVAASEGHISIAEYLLDNNADISHEGNLDRSPIAVAARAGSTELVKFLLDRGANLHWATESTWTLLHLSSMHAETTRFLLENGVDVNRAGEGGTPLVFATCDNQSEVVKVLLSFKADTEIPYCGDTPGLQGFTALNFAMAQENMEIARLLLEAGADVNHRADSGIFPIAYAVIKNKEIALRVLLEHHPDLGVIDADGDTALGCIGTSTSMEIAKLLVEAGSDLRARNKHGDTPLTLAIIRGNTEIVKYLVAQKAEINVIDGKYGGPLHQACRWVNLELVKILVEGGADVNLTHPSFLGSPIQSTCICFNSDENLEKQETIIRYLINEGGADVTIPGGLQRCAINTACGWSTPGVVKLLLEKGAKIDIRDEMGRVAIHSAAAQNVDIFQQILDAGGDVEVEDNVGRTVLHRAALGGLTDVAERILSLSPSLINQPDIDGWTPLLWAAGAAGMKGDPAKPNTREAMVRFLLNRGADPCSKGRWLGQQSSPVKLARFYQLDEAVIQLLVRKAREKREAENLEDPEEEEESAASDTPLITNEYYCDCCISVSKFRLPSISSPFSTASHPVLRPLTYMLIFNLKDPL